MKNKLDTVVAGLLAAFGDDLRAVVIYGSGAAPGKEQTESNLNLLVVAKVINSARLQAAAATVAEWVAADNPPPLVLSDAEWRSSADIFPMEYADVMEQHRVLYGALDISGLELRVANLRLQLEQETMGKLQRLRQALLLTQADESRISAMVGSSFSRLAVLLRAVIRLHGERPPTDPNRLVEVFSRLTNINTSSIRQGGARPSRPGSDAAQSAVAQAALLAELLAALLVHVDRFVVTSDIYRVTPINVSKGDQKQ